MFHTEQACCRRSFEAQIEQPRFGLHEPSQTHSFRAEREQLKIRYAQRTPRCLCPHGAHSTRVLRGLPLTVALSFLAILLAGITQFVTRKMSRPRAGSRTLPESVPSGLAGANAPVLRAARSDASTARASLASASRAPSPAGSPPWTRSGGTASKRVQA
jgi:hypothetical protein